MTMMSHVYIFFTLKRYYYMYIIVRVDVIVNVVKARLR